MKYKQFRDWCNQRTCDGCWSMGTALYCIGIIEKINQSPFWKREKIWKNEYENLVVTEVVNVINRKMEERGIINANRN